MISLYVWEREGGNLETEDSVTVVAMARSLEEAADAITRADKYRSVRPVTWRIGLLPWTETGEGDEVVIVQEKRPLIEPTIILLPESAAIALPEGGIAWFTDAVSATSQPSGGLPTG